jgi:uncharacterized protein (DUF362 family)
LAKVAVVDGGQDLVQAVEDVFAPFGQVLAGRKRAFIKVNAIDCRPETYTSPAVLAAVLQVLGKYGVEDLYVMENCTQGNFTRMVFAATDLGKVCRRNKAKIIYLDEQPVVEMELPGLGENARFPRLLVEEFGGEEREAFYLNLPRLKAHSMSVVTLGTKNQLGLMDQQDRMKNHNFNLHARLAAIAQLFRPDFTLIDGLKAVFYGHYPPASVVDRCTENLNVLLGGPDMLAVDTVGAKILGYSVEEVPHLSLAREQGWGCGRLEDIEVIGDLSRFTKKYPYHLLPEFPEDVTIIKGSERCCPEGCELNTKAVLQFLYLDHQGKGGFTILMGKGFDREQLKALRGPVLLAGKCASREALPLVQANCSKIYTSPECNDLASTIKALTKLMKVNPLKLVPVSPLKSLGLLALAKLHGSRARVGM